MFNIIAYWLKYYRNACGITQQQVADCLRIERSTYTYYETGKTTPNIDTLLKIAKIYQVDYLELLKGCNTVTGKYVNDSEFDRIVPANSDISIKSQDKKYGNARFETEVMLKTRMLNDEQREELMETLNSMTNTTTKNTATWISLSSPKGLTNRRLPHQGGEIIAKKPKLTPQENQELKQQLQEQEYEQTAQLTPDNRFSIQF